MGSGETDRPKSGGRVAALLAALLILAGAGSFVAASAMAPKVTQRLVGGNLPLDAGTTDPLVLKSENSPVVVANPRDRANLVVADRIDRPDFSCAVRSSFDGGATWTNAVLAVPSDRSIKCFTPDLGFGPDGILYLTFATFDPVAGQGLAPDAVWVAASRDGGRNFGAPLQIGGPLAFQVRLGVDPTVAGRLFVTWVQVADTTGSGFAAAGNPVVITGSTDGGATWSKPVNVNPPARASVVAPVLAGGPGGVLYLAYVDVGDDKLDYTGASQGRGGPPYDGTWSLVVARSADSGRTWREVMADAKVKPARRFIQLFPPTPAVAVDGQRVYVAFTDGRDGDPDVWLWRSTDGGDRWDAARRVNDTPVRDARTQEIPGLAIAPNGRLDVVYYDRRADPADVQTEVSLQSSFDGGRTFTKRLRLSDRQFDSQIGFGSERDLPELGTRVGVLSTGGGVLALWSDTRNGTRAVQKQVLAKAVATVARRAPGVAAPLRAGGALAAALGAALAGFAVMGRRRRSDEPAPSDVAVTV